MPRERITLSHPSGHDVEALILSHAPQTLWFANFDGPATRHSVDVLNYRADGEYRLRMTALIHGIRYTADMKTPVSSAMPDEYAEALIANVLHVELPSALTHLTPKHRFEHAEAEHVFADVALKIARHNAQLRDQK